MARLVSIVTPAFHAEDFIARAVASVIAQDYPAWELVVVSDDGQDYRQIFKARNIPADRIIFVSTGKIGSGPSRARNIGLDHANGRIVATLDADDEFLPGKLAIMPERALECGLCTCALEYGEYGDGGTMRRIPVAQPFDTSGRLTASQYPLVNYSTNSMVVFDREALPIRWPEGLHVAEDIVFAMQAYDYVDAVYHCPQALHRYVRRARSLTNSAGSARQLIHVKKEILRLLQSPDFCVRSLAARESLQLFLAISLETEEEYERALAKGESEDVLFAAMLAVKLSKNSSASATCL